MELIKEGGFFDLEIKVTFAILSCLNGAPTEMGFSVGSEESPGGGEQVDFLSTAAVWTPDGRSKLTAPTRLNVTPM